MKTNFKTISQAPSITTLVMQAAVLALLFAAEPSFAAGLEKINGTAQMISSTLGGLAVVSGTIALMYSGYKMMFQSAKWSEVANVVYGSVFVSGATGISSWLMA